MWSLYPVCTEGELNSQRKTVQIILYNNIITELDILHLVIKTILATELSNKFVIVVLNKYKNNLMIIL